MASSDLAYWVLVRLHYVRAIRHDRDASAAAIAQWVAKQEKVGRVSEDEVYGLLRNLEQLGMVLALEDEGEQKAARIIWAIRGGLPPDWVTVWRDGGDGGDGETPPTSPTGDGPGGEGLGEVLAHPVLFSLPAEQLKSRIEQAFGIWPEGTDPGEARP